MPAAMLDQVPPFVALSTLTGMILTLGAMPAMPCPLFIAAAMMPATCVPWPWSSLGSVSLLT